MSSYEKVKRAKLSFKGDLEPSKKIDKKKKKKKHKKSEDAEENHHQEEDDKIVSEVKDLDVGVGHAPDGGKKTRLYEELFPVETKRFGYETEKTLTREEALDIRVKKKADRYCK